MKRAVKRLLSFVLAIVIVFGLVPSTIFMSSAVGTNAEVVSNVDTSTLTDGVFYLSAESIKVYEGGNTAKLTINRFNNAESEAKVRLTAMDYTATYGKDYKIKIESSEVFNERNAN